MNKTNFERLYNGLVKENPTFVLMLGMCPTLAVTTSAINGMGMGLTTAVVLALSNLIISLMRKIIPSKVRIPAFIVIIASFVTIVQLLLEAYLPSLNEALGVYIPLIVVNCIILGRAEAYAYSNPPIPSLFDGIGMGLGFTVALTIIGAVREVLGAAKIFGIAIPNMVPIGIFVLAPGAFFVLAVLTAIQNFIKIQGEKRGKDMSKIQFGCNEDCMNCADAGCSRRFYDAEAFNENAETKEVAGEVAEVIVEETVALQEPKKRKAKKILEEVEVIDLDAEADQSEVTAEEKATEEPEQPTEKPKRNPRKKKAEVTEPVEPAEDTTAGQSAETPAEEAAEESTSEDKSSEETIQPAEEKPKRKPRKKKTAAAEPAEVSEEEKASEESEQPAEEKPKRKSRKKKAEATPEAAEVAEAVDPVETAKEEEDK